MARVPPAGLRRSCVCCGVMIPCDRILALPGVRTCLECQAQLERSPVARDGEDARPESPIGEESAAQPDPPWRTSVELEGNEVVVGGWSASLMDVVSDGAQAHRLVQEGRRDEARSLVRSLPLEAQAALVVLGEDPEEMLSLTGVDGSGAPCYLEQVVDLLPAELLSGLIAVAPEEEKYNTELIRAMSPEAFRKTVEETLEHVEGSGRRTKVSWEWLRALSACGDPPRISRLIRSVDVSLLEEALLDRVASLDLNAVVSSGGVSIYRFQLFSELGEGGVRPSAFVEDPETGEVLDALYEAAPDLLCGVVRGAWERAEGGPA